MRKPAAESVRRGYVFRLDFLTECRQADCFVFRSDPAARFIPSQFIVKLPLRRFVKSILKGNQHESKT